MNSPESNREVPSVKGITRSKNTSWQIPPGVTKANWEYAQARHISTGYDDFLKDDPLTAVDRQIVFRYLPDITQDVPPTVNQYQPIVADFGCGNGRTLAPLLRRGYRGIGVDLSIPMLDRFIEKEAELLTQAIKPSPASGLILTQANLVELEAFHDHSVDHAISLFSTLGMIQGRKHRSAFLAHARRMIKPGGTFIVHAHNVWNLLRHPGGVRWALGSVVAQLRGKLEFGDRQANYRSINQMFIHSFRRRELEAALRMAGFQQLEWFGILPGVETAIEKFPVASSVRLVGWIVVCR